MAAGITTVQNLLNRYTHVCRCNPQLVDSTLLNPQFSGNLLLAGNDKFPCTASALGLVRRNPTTGRMQAYR